MFKPAELRRIVDAADVQLKAMVLLGVNCGYGNNDVAKLPITALDLEGGWIDYPRPKTGVGRRCPLWPETVQALQVVLDRRRIASDHQHDGLVFLKPNGRPYSTEKLGANEIGSRHCRKLLDKLGLYRPGLSFYTLRHVFQTIADEAGDYIATRKIMGHADSSISDAYRERFPDERLRKVSDHVRQWLFGAEGGA